jgi:ribosomal protein S12 methylthiotransferase accessory factor
MYKLDRYPQPAPADPPRCWDDIGVHTNALADPLGGMIVGGNSYSRLSVGLDVLVQTLRFFIRSHPSRGEASIPVLKSSSGSGGSSKEASLPAIGEMLERHAAYSIDDTRVFTATAKELGTYALDLESLPTCSLTELSHPKCYITPPKKDKPIRWIEGISLASGRPYALPYSTVTLRTDDFMPQERLQAPISTGLASHRTIVQALSAALLEVIERDALSIMWLQKLPGRKLDIDTNMRRRQIVTEAPEIIGYEFFDISTNLEIPVACCIRTAVREVSAHTMISCAAGFSETELVRKLLNDIGAQSIGFARNRQVPEYLEDFTAVHHGSIYMAHRDRSSLFSFLRTGGLASLNWDQYPHGQEQQLAFLLKRLSACGAEAFAVDLTSVEAFAVGARVVRVLVPALQPLPYRYMTRYLGHQRLYEAPRQMGHQVKQERDINPWPHPFA